MYARITTADGSFNEVCDVRAAGPLVALGMITYDGEAERGEYCYTVEPSRTGEVLRMLAARLESEASEHEGRSPGYPGPCPEGMDWSAWLAFNNVD